MRTVWKYLLWEEGTSILMGPDDRVVLVGVDPSGDQTRPAIWIEHLDTEVGFTRSREYVFAGTGHPLDPPDGAPQHLAHVGSVVMPTGLVWHVYERSI